MILSTLPIFSNKNVSIGEFNLNQPQAKPEAITRSQVFKKPCGRGARDWGAAIDAAPAVVAPAALAQAVLISSAYEEIVRRLDGPIRAAQFARDLLRSQHHLAHGFLDR